MTNTAPRNKSSDLAKPSVKPAAKTAKTAKTVKARSKASGRNFAKPAAPVAVTAAAPAPQPTSAVAKVTKRDQLAALLVRDEGATLDQMIAVTGWLPHTTRAALTGLKKQGYAIDSDKIDGVRTYRAETPK